MSASCVTHPRWLTKEEPPTARPDALDVLTPRQMIVMRDRALGEAVRQIAVQRSITPGTVKNTLRNAYMRLQITDLAHPALRAAYLLGKYDQMLGR